MPEALEEWYDPRKEPCRKWRQAPRLHATLQCRPHCSLHHWLSGKGWDALSVFPYIYHTILKDFTHSGFLLPILWLPALICWHLPHERQGLFLLQHPCRFGLYPAWDVPIHCLRVSSAALHFCPGNSGTLSTKILPLDMFHTSTDHKWKYCHTRWCL